MCIEREKDNFKSREVNCLKECALALRQIDIVSNEGTNEYRVLAEVKGRDTDKEVYS